MTSSVRDDSVYRFFMTASEPNSVTIPVSEDGEAAAGIVRAGGGSPEEVEFIREATAEDFYYAAKSFGRDAAAEVRERGVEDAADDAYRAAMEAAAQAGYAAAVEVAARAAYRAQVADYYHAPAYDSRRMP